MASAADETKTPNDRLLALGPLNPEAYPFKEIPSPPSNAAKCKLSLIRIATGIIPAPLFIASSEPGSAFIAPVFAFLVEKEHEGKTNRISFDLGIRTVRGGICWDIAF